LGWIHEGKNVPDLASTLEVRLNDTNSIPPEDNRVRWMCAYSLGRMKAENTLPSLRRYYFNSEPSEDPINNACGWAIEQITGEKMPAPRTIRKPQRDWFLIPVLTAAP
jgi:HEAT repeat protein